MVKVRIYVEGGGDDKRQHAQCREGFRKLLDKAGFTGRMPGIVAGGGRRATYDMFRTAVATGVLDTCPLLLVDSEDPVAVTDNWEHLKYREKWERPAGVTDDQAQLMVTCMETWIMADRSALAKVFGAQLQTSALFPPSALEERSREEVQAALAHATRNCGRDKVYAKGRRSFQVLAELDPHTLKQYVSHFQRLIDALNRLTG